MGKHLVSFFPTIHTAHKGVLDVVNCRQKVVFASALTEKPTPESPILLKLTDCPLDTTANKTAHTNDDGAKNVTEEHARNHIVEPSAQRPLAFGREVRVPVWSRMCHSLLLDLLCLRREKEKTVKGWLGSARWPSTCSFALATDARTFASEDDDLAGIG